jgi:hypothetical protein
MPPMMQNVEVSPAFYPGGSNMCMDDCGRSGKALALCSLNLYKKVFSGTLQPAVPASTRWARRLFRVARQPEHCSRDVPTLHPSRSPCSPVGRSTNRRLSAHVHGDALPTRHVVLRDGRAGHLVVVAHKRSRRTVDRGLHPVAVRVVYERGAQGNRPARPRLALALPLCGARPYSSLAPHIQHRIPLYFAEYAETMLPSALTRNWSVEMRFT